MSIFWEDLCQLSFTPTKPHLTSWKGAQLTTSLPSTPPHIHSIILCNIKVLGPSGPRRLAGDPSEHRNIIPFLIKVGVQPTIMLGHLQNIHTHIKIPFSVKSSQKLADLVSEERRGENNHCCPHPSLTETICENFYQFFPL